VRRHRFAAVADALADHDGAHQAGNGGVDVYHGAAGEVQRAFLPDPASLQGFAGRGGGVGDQVRTGPEPHHVGRWQVGEGEPQHDEGQNRGKLGALGKRADDQCAGDGSKRALESHEDELGNDDALAEGGGGGKRALGRIPDTVQEQAVEATEEGGFFREGNRVAVDAPQHDDQREHHEHLHQHRQHVLRTHQAAVEQGQAGDGHQDHQQGADHHEAGIALVGDGRGGWRGSGRGRCGGSGRGVRHGRHGGGGNGRSRGRLRLGGRIGKAWRGDTKRTQAGYPGEQFCYIFMHQYSP